MKKYFVYILTNKSYTLYIGVTNNIRKRIYQHRHASIHAFTKKYNINKLIYIEEFRSIIEALDREKQLKNWSRKKKISLIKSINPKFEELIP